MTTVTALEQAAQAVVLSAQSFVDAHTANEVDGALAVITATISQLEGFRVRLIRERGISDRSVLSDEFGLARGEAAQLEKVVRRLAPLRELQDAVEGGSVTMSKARMVADVITNERTSAAARDARALTELASTLPPNQLARELERWSRSVDEERGVDTDETLRAKRSLEIHRRHDGMTEVMASLDPESAEIVKTALDARVQIEWRGETAEQHTERTSAQRRADAIVGICRDWLSGSAASTDATPGGAPRSRPHVSVIINLDDLTAETGHGTTERGTPLSAQAIRRIACDAGISAIFTNSRSEIIDIGREQRTFTGAIRKALVLRDQGCRHPSCNAPPSWTEGHHIIHWANGGETTTANGCLLCHHHHHAVHEGGWTITGNANHRLTFTAPSGTTLTSHPPGLTIYEAA